MAWMFRWLELLLGRLPRLGGDADAWVEPSNAITRAVLSQSFAPLPAVAVEAAVVEVAEPVPAEVAAPAEPETRTERRSRRRRSARAA
jgi:hypothetical protein